MRNNTEHQKQAAVDIAESSGLGRVESVDAFGIVSGNLYGSIQVNDNAHVIAGNQYVNIVNQIQTREFQC